MKAALRITSLVVIFAAALLQTCNSQTLKGKMVSFELTKVESNEAHG